ncbi:hypothetical protein QCA50_006213 [Cerrena zonata]|uniref:Uncharacterized protein n=1 Tax=Cerrena zonata TaxID=2478898 RepID=A0AAW0GCR4_9APHY
MAHRDPSSSSGLFSNVLSFVSREIESFVTTATGGEPTQKASSSRNRLDSKPYDKSKRSKKRKHDTSRKEKDADGTRREQGQLGGGEAGSPPPQRRRSKSPAMPPPPVPAHALTKKKSVTMPGSFFPRSPSLEPDYAASLLDNSGAVMSNDELLRSVREDAGPSTTPSTPRSRRSISSIRSEPSPSPIAISGGPSVRGAVDRFTDDADHSLMLPKTVQSPERVFSSPRSQAKSAKARGKERDLSGWDCDFSFSGDTSGEIRVRGIEQELLAAREAHYRKELEEDPDSSVYVEEREHDKERIRTLEEEVAKLKRQLAEQRVNPRMDPPPAPIPPPPPPLWTSASLPSSMRNNKTTESFLASARACLRPTSLPEEVPINPAVYGSRTKRTGVPTFNMPTEKMAAFLTEMKSVKLKRVRNGPKQPPRRVEADPNDSSFNMSSASIRRDILKDLVERDRAERSVSFDSDSQIGDKRKRAEDDDRSLKRRATEPFFSDSSSSSIGSASSVPLTDSQTSSSGTYRSWPTASNNGTEITTPSLCSDNENEPEAEQAEDKLLTTPTETHAESRRQRFEIHQDEDILEVPEVRVERETTPSPPQKSVPIQQPQPVSASKRNPFSKRIPSSPLPSATPKKPVGPARQRARTASQQKALAAQAAESDDEVVVPVSPTKVRKTTAKPIVFKFQPLAGPSRIPRKQDKKDGSQSRESSRQISRPSSTASLRNTSTASQPVPEPSRPSSVPTTQHVQRRRTLDEELRRAGDRLWQEADDEAEDDDLESGILVAVGTKKRKGFLAKGGSAGTPVYMGSGYVQGAEDDDDDEP